MNDEEIHEFIEENTRLRNENKFLSSLSGSKRVEFSKVIIAGIAVMTAALTIFACFMIWKTGDTSVLAYLIPAVYTEMASATGFYYSKAKAENKIKLMALTGTKPDKQTFETM